MDHSKAKVYTQNITVQPEEIDTLDHVNNIVYLKWVQDIAVAHWKYQASPVDQESCIWVVLRHEINYKSPAFLGDQLEVKTYVGETSGPTSERIVEIYRDSKLLAETKTKWCLLDSNSKQPRKIAKEMNPFFNEKNEKGT